MTRTTLTAAIISTLLVSDAFAVVMTDPTGGSGAHNNVQPSLGLNFLVQTEGNFDDLGDLTIFGGNFAPRGYMQADGQLLSIASNTALFSVLGTTYGGDGRTTFALPDLRGRTPIGAGSGPGLSSYRLGQKLGSETVTLNTAQLPVHDHGIPGTTDRTGVAGGGQSHPNMQPSLALNYTINLQGVFPGGGNDLIAQMELTAKSFADRGEALAQGQLLPINQNSALFSLVGTTYGGDGRTTLGLPDLRGRAGIHEGQGPGLTNRQLGSKGGAESVTLNTAQLPQHDHGIPSSTDNTDATGGGAAHPNMQPFQTLNYMIALTGVFPSRGDGQPGNDGGEPYVGEIALFAGNFAPRGWAFLDGQLLDIAQNTALFSILGTIYGGDGRTTFGLPDLRGRTPVHYGNGPGLSPWRIGERRGAETETLTIAEMTSHQHSLPDRPTGVPVASVPALLLAGLFGLLGTRRRLRS